MKIIKNILIGIGVIFVVIVGFVIFIIGNSSVFREEKTPFIEYFMSEFSEGWKTSSVNSRFTNDLRRHIDSPKGRHDLEAMQSLGVLESMSEPELGFYTNPINSGKWGKFTFKAQFSNGFAFVELSVVEKDDKTQVDSLHFTPAYGVLIGNTKHEV